MSTVQWLQLAFGPWRGKIQSSKWSLRRRVNSPCVTCEISLPWLIVQLKPTHSFPLSPSHWLCSKKWFPSPLQPCGFSLSQFKALNLTSATFSSYNGTDCFLNPQIILLDVFQIVECWSSCIQRTRQIKSPSTTLSAILTPPEHTF